MEIYSLDWTFYAKMLENLNVTTKESDRGDKIDRRSPDWSEKGTAKLVAMDITNNPMLEI